MPGTHIGGFEIDYIHLPVIRKHYRIIYYYSLIASFFLLQPNIRENGAGPSVTLKQYKLLSAYTDLDSGPISILNSLGQSAGHKELIGMPTLHFGSRSPEF